MRTAAFLMLLVVSLSASAADFTGKVLAAPAADTLQVQGSAKPVTLHLAGVVSPHAPQRYGDEAQKAVEAFVKGKTVTVQEKVADKDGSITALVLIGDVSLNASVLTSGLGWADPQSRLLKDAETLQSKAKDGKQGLWADPAPIAPWEWRPEMAKRAPEKPKAIGGDWRPIAPAKGEEDSLLQTVIAAKRVETEVQDRAAKAEFTPQPPSIMPYLDMPYYWDDPLGAYGIGPGYDYPLQGSYGSYDYPYYAANGSYYGQLNSQGRPKDVHVNGYFRRDGTYVRSHYRARPRR